MSLSSFSFSFNSTWQLFICAWVKTPQQWGSLSNTLVIVADVRHATPAQRAFPSCYINKDDDDDDDDCYYCHWQFFIMQMFWRSERSSIVSLIPFSVWFKAVLWLQGQTQDHFQSNLAVMCCNITDPSVWDLAAKFFFHLNRCHFHHGRCPCTQHMCKVINPDYLLLVSLLEPSGVI